MNIGPCENFLNLLLWIPDNFWKIDNFFFHCIWLSQKCTFDTFRAFTLYQWTFYRAWDQLHSLILQTIMIPLLCLHTAYDWFEEKKNPIKFVRISICTMILIAAHFAYYIINHMFLFWLLLLLLLYREAGYLFKISVKISCVKICDSNQWKQFCN